MRITKISVKGLFGMFDHEIPLNQESRITIVYGPNGVGKTVLMRMVDGLFNYGYQLIGSIPFDLLRIEFDSGAFVTVEKVKAAERLFIVYVDKGGIRSDVYFTPPADSEFEHKLMSAMNDALPNYVQFSFGGTTYWADVFKDYEYARLMLAALLSGDTEARESYPSRDRFDILTENELFEKHPQIHAKVCGDTPDWFAYIGKEVETRQIQTQRLLSHSLSDDEIYQMFGHSEDNFDFPRAFPAVWDFSEKIRDKFRNALVRIFEKSSGTQFETRVQEMLNNLEAHENFQELSRHEWKQEVIKFLLESTKEDIAPAHQGEDVMEEIAVFEEITNERLLFKQLTVDEEDGFTITNDRGAAVYPSNLSSGEQQLIVLYYQLLFEIEPDTLVMIDEPELSMNVVWQRNFLKDLQRIIELRKFDVLIATHSPQIIHDKWDWVVHLGEKVDD